MEVPLVFPKPTVLLLVAASLLGGCATVERAREAQDPAMAVPGERTPSAAELGLTPGSVVGESAVVEAALLARPSVVRARRRRDVAEAQLGSARAALYPKLSLGATYTGTGSRRVGEGGGATAPVTGSGSLSAQLSWLVYDFGKTPARIRAAALRLVAAEADVRAAEVSAAYDARAAYIALERETALLDVARTTVRQLEERREQVRALVEVGSRIPYDLTKAELDLGTARLAEVKQRGARASAETALAAAIGLAERTDLRAEPLPATASAEAVSPFDAAWERARGGEPTIAAAQARVAAASSVLDAQVAALYPSLSVGASASLGTTQLEGGAGDGVSVISSSVVGSAAPFTWSWSAGPSVSWTLFDGFQMTAAIEEAAAELRSARTDTAQAEQKVWQALRDAYIEFDTARERLEVAGLNLVQAQEQLELAQARFAAGSATSLEVTDGEQALATARGERVRAQSDAALARAVIHRSTGSIGEGVQP